MGLERLETQSKQKKAVWGSQTSHSHGRFQNLPSPAFSLELGEAHSQDWYQGYQIFCPQISSIPGNHILGEQDVCYNMESFIEPRVHTVGSQSLNNNSWQF